MGGEATLRRLPGAQGHLRTAAALITASGKRARTAGPGASAAAGAPGQELQRAPALAGEGGRGPGAAPAEPAEPAEDERERERALRAAGVARARSDAWALEAWPGLIEAVVMLVLRARPALGPGLS